VTQDGEIVCAHFRVRGQVQGVFYRASTEAVALRLGLNGWVRNSSYGDVELIACGTLRQLDELEEWLWRGPSSAHVADVQRAQAPFQTFHGVEVRR
jgi:acylphosphatase